LRNIYGRNSPIQDFPTKFDFSEQRWRQRADEGTRNHAFQHDGFVDNIIMVVEPTKTNTTEVLGVGECFIEIKELRKLEGNDFIRKNIRIMGGYPMATVADANMNIRIQKKIDEIAETERSDDDWNPEDFD